MPEESPPIRGLRLKVARSSYPATEAGSSFSRDAPRTAGESGSCRQEWESDMRRIVMAACAVATLSLAAGAQSLQDLNIQIHGYATQGFLYTNNNNWFTMDSNSGSPAWTEAVVNLTAQPEEKLRIGVQARYMLLGNFGNAVTLDWASLDYKVSDKFGIRVGKVKTPWGLFNEVQDIDPAYMWALLPQGIYPLDDREGYLTHYGGIVYGTWNASIAGKVEYRVFGGQGLYPDNNGFYLAKSLAGYSLPSGDIAGTLYGGALHWRTPLKGLMLGASVLKDNTWTAAETFNNGTSTAYGTLLLPANSQPNFFAKYEKDKWMVAFEYERNWGNAQDVFPLGTTVTRSDDRSEYQMLTYKVLPKLTLGVYNSQNSDHQAPLGPGRYQKDWTISGKFDFDQYLYAKVEQHFTKGNGLDVDDGANTVVLPTNNVTALKVGVTF
jgi:hypothetical protein